MIVPKPTLVPGPHNSREEERKQRDLGVGGASVESVPPRTRRKFSASEKQRIVKAAAAAVEGGERGALVALLRREGIYSSHLATWRQQFAARGADGLSAQKPGRKPKFDAKDLELLALKKENAKLEKKLRIANALIGLQKKAHEILGIALPEHDEET